MEPLYLMKPLRSTWQLMLDERMDMHRLWYTDQLKNNSTASSYDCRRMYFIVHMLLDQLEDDRRYMKRLYNLGRICITFGFTFLLVISFKLKNY